MRKTIQNFIFILLITAKSSYAQEPYKIGIVKSPSALFNSYGTVYFLAQDSSYSTGLWKSNGTAQNTVFVKKFLAKKGDGLEFAFSFNYKNRLFFTFKDSLHGRELWTTDGSDSNTHMVKDIYPGRGDSYLYPHLNPVNLNGTMYFCAKDSLYGEELWKTDGTEQGTVLVKDIYSGFQPLTVPPYTLQANSSNPQLLTVLNNEFYFTAVDSVYGRELWKSDGTANGTVMIKDISPGYQSSYPSSLIACKGNIYFFAFVGSRFALWKTDGTEAGTVEIKEFKYNDDVKYIPNYITAFKDNLYFYADDGLGKGKELWKSDGTANGTVLLKDIEPGAASSYASSHFETVTDDYLFFQTIYGPYRTDGTENGTYSLNKGFSISDPYVAAKDGVVYFTGVTDSGTSQQITQLWRTDGTLAGTLPVKGTNCYSGMGPRGVTEANGMIFYAGCAFSANYEYTLWKLDFPTRIGITSQTDNTFTIFPNPFSSAAIVKFIAPQQNAAIKIMDVLGNTVRELHFSGIELTFEKGNLAAGIYVIQVMNKEGKVGIKKMIIE